MNKCIERFKFYHRPFMNEAYRNSFREDCDNPSEIFPFPFSLHEATTGCKDGKSAHQHESFFPFHRIKGEITIWRTAGTQMHPGCVRSPTANRPTVFVFSKGPARQERGGKDEDEGERPGWVHEFFIPKLVEPSILRRRLTSDGVGSKR